MIRFVKGARGTMTQETRTVARRTTEGCIAAAGRV